MPVDLGPRSYEVRVVSGRPDEFGPFVRGRARGDLGRPGVPVGLDRHRREPGGLVGSRRAIATPWRRSGSTATLAVLPPGEATKSLACASRLYDELVAIKADRHTASSPWAAA